MIVIRLAQNSLVIMVLCVLISAKASKHLEKEGKDQE